MTRRPVQIDHDGKTAIVTGGSRGIGRAVARELVRSGARVLVTGRKRPALEATAAELGPACLWRACHAAAAEDAAECVAFAVEEFGRVDYLVNNAATNPQWGPTIDVPAPLAAKLTEVNQWAPLLWTQLLWRAGMREHGGAVVNVTSIGAFAPSPNTGYYNATKAALDHLTRQLAAELAPAVRVNAVAPGMVDTEMAAAIPEAERARLLDGIPLNRFGSPEDIAAATSFLLSDRAGWLTGHVLVVDGGALVANGRSTS
ncbi:SDR family oxidoreductase [Phytohabitans kaempferiae]|uniref:SDR family oxidoreductase n=1 Tax=Phytohabitans kaempferiae TaxID=1620943 RepID=A0ABV6M642_9ACTN